MDNLLKQVIDQKLSDGTVEKIMAEQFERAVTKAVTEMFSWRGEGLTLVETKMKEVMLPQIEKFDFNRFLPKLNLLLMEMVKQYRLPEYKKMTENFSRLLDNSPIEDKTITVTRLGEIFGKYVSKNVDTSELEINYDDGATYERCTVTADFTQDDRPSWSRLEKGCITFECEQDEDLKFVVEVHKWERDKEWSMEVPSNVANLQSIKNLNDFELQLAQFIYQDCKLDIDTEGYIDDEVEVEAEPEPSYN